MPRRDADSMGGGTVGGWTARRGRRGRWWRGTTAAYVDFRLAYDRNGNITSETDQLVARQVTGGAWTAGDHYFDRVFTNDNLNRLAKADEGKMSGASIASSKHTRTEEWILSQTGNWDNQKLDLDGDGTNERDWNATFNAANECTARGGVTPTTPYDEVGNMIDDAVNYTYVYDVFGRLKTVKTRGGSPVTVSEYTYNGLGHRIGWHYDADTDADVDGSDPWYWFFYDERWRMVVTYRASDANPKERFVYHNAGLNGYGGSSYVDSTILRDADDTAGWASAAPDSTLQTRYYYLQNWRADVVALIEADGDPVEYVRYSAYGVPFVYGAGDVNRDGQVSILDNYAWDDFNQSGLGDMAVDDDVNRDGTVDSDDVQLITDQDGWGAWGGDGRGFVSRVSNRKGYAGYEFDPATTQWHVRNRVLVSEMGRWSRRDPMGYFDANTLLAYVNSGPLVNIDPLGLMSDRCAASSQCYNMGTDPEIVGPTKPWRPSDMCASPSAWPNCNDCAAKAEIWASTRNLHPGGPCYENTIRLYMMYCISLQNGHDGAFSELQKCRQIGIPNGCGAADGTTFPEGNFGGCCNQHDTCYGTCNMLKAYCDLQFLACMFAQCDQESDWFRKQICRTWAATYFDAVYLMGRGAYSEAQRRACAGGTGQN